MEGCFERYAHANLLWTDVLAPSFPLEIIFQDIGCKHEQWSHRVADACKEWMTNFGEAGTSPETYVVAKRVADCAEATKSLKQRVGSMHVVQYSTWGGPQLLMGAHLFE
eukprot:scaffold45999_cov37-Prasinocladus_malaysianus.AAC.4